VPYLWRGVTERGRLGNWRGHRSVLRNNECCPSPISRPAKTIDLDMVSGRAPRNAARRSHPRCDPIRVVDWSRPPVRNACPAPPIGCPEGVRIGAFDGPTGCCGCSCDGCGHGGATRWCWFSRRPSIGGTAIGLFAAGGAVRDVLDDHASMCCVAISLGAWLRRIACGVRREFTANCSSSESSFQNAPCRVTCETGRRDRHRPGAHLSRITWASSNSTRECCHRTCGR